MKNIKKINILSLIVIVCVSLVYVALKNNEFSVLDKQAKEEKMQSQNTKKEDMTSDTDGNHFPTNKNGETYGTSIVTEDGEYIDPDLIEAIGEDNIEGYVRYDDVFGNDNEYDPREPERVPIPLYKSDGITVIGEFIIDNRDTVEGLEFRGDKK